MWKCENPNLYFSKNKICTLNSFWALRTIQLNLEDKMSKIHKISEIHIRFSKFWTKPSCIKNLSSQLLLSSENEHFEVGKGIRACWIKFCIIFVQFGSKVDTEYQWIWYWILANFKWTYLEEYWSDEFNFWFFRKLIILSFELARFR